MSIPYKLFNDFKFSDNIILEGYRGSISHGVYVKDHIDDKDIFGIFIPSKEYIIGLKEYEHYEKQIKEWDVLYYSLKKFIGLALKGNPNVLSLLWLQPKFYTIITDLGKELIDNKNIFTAKSCYYNFSGYAYGQLRKIEKFKFDGYMGEKRKQLVEKFGYDAKNASHCIRLLKMGIEFLTTGELNVWREDNQMLLAIKLGEWDIEKIKQEADRLFKLSDEAFIRSKLKDHPNHDKANKLLIDLHEKYWETKKCQ